MFSRILCKFVRDPLVVSVRTNVRLGNRRSLIIPKLHGYDDLVTSLLTDCSAFLGFDDRLCFDDQSGTIYQHLLVLGWVRKCPLQIRPLHLLQLWRYVFSNYNCKYSNHRDTYCNSNPNLSNPLRKAVQGFNR